MNLNLFFFNSDKIPTQYTNAVFAVHTFKTVYCNVSQVEYMQCFYLYIRGLGVGVGDCM